MLNRMPAVLFILFCCLFCLRCYENERGCLDIEATNYDLTADEPCRNDEGGSNCPCEYPTARINKVIYHFNGAVFNGLDTFYVLDGQPFRLAHFQFFLSDFRFLQNGEPVGVEDTISLTIQDENNNFSTQVFEDNIDLLTGQSSISIGDVSQSGQFSGLQFTVGLKHPIRTTTPELVSRSSHELATEAMYSEDLNSYIFNKITYYPDTSSSTVATVLNITDTSIVTQIALSKRYSSEPGAAILLDTLIIDYGKWLTGINFVQDNKEEITRKIVQNTNNEVFSLH